LNLALKQCAVIPDIKHFGESYDSFLLWHPVAGGIIGPMLQVIDITLLCSGVIY
jgi:hypothetical protein